MTPALFNALAKRYAYEQRVEDHRAGVISSLFANSCRDPKRRPQPFMPKDFFPSLEEPKKDQEKPRQTAAEQIATAAAITKLLGGTDLRKKKRKRADKRS